MKQYLFTIILPAQQSLTWDLGEAQGTVAVRMPDRRVALELIAETGPLAVSSANLTGRDAAILAADAQEMLGDSVAVYLEEGYREKGIPSTIIDATSLVGATDDETPLVRILREGAISREQLETVLGDLLEAEEQPGDVVDPEQAEVDAVDGKSADAEAGQPESSESPESPVDKE